LLLIGWPENAQECIDICEKVVYALEFIGLVVELGQAVAGAVDYAEDLGIESTKLKICGRKKSSIVLVKWPKIPTMAKVMPAK